MVAGRYAGAQQAEFATTDAVGRVSHRLVELSERFRATGEAGIEIALPLSRRSWRPGRAHRARPSARRCGCCARCGSSGPGAATLTVLALDALRQRTK
jgi:hypothetical protein